MGYLVNPKERKQLQSEKYLSSRESQFVPLLRCISLLHKVASATAFVISAVVFWALLVEVGHTIGDEK